MSFKLYDYQLPAADALEKALLKHRAAADLSILGSGKTIVACEVARRLGCPVAVLTKKAVVPKWIKMMAEFGVEPLFVLNYEAVRTGKTKWLTWKKQGRGKTATWHLPADTLLVSDECHVYQSSKSANSKMARAAKPFRNLLLSATLAEDPLDMQATGYLLGMHEWSDFFFDCRKLYECGQNTFGGLIFPRWVKNAEIEKLGLPVTPHTRDKVTADLKAKVLNRIHSYIIPEHGYRVTRDDCAHMFAENTVRAEAFDLGASKAIVEAYKQEAEELAELVASDADNLSACQLVVRGKTRQLVESLKCPGVAEMARDHVAEGNSVIIFVNYTASLETLQTLLKTTCCIHGGQTGKRGAEERAKCMEDFLADRERIIIVNTEAGGTGIDLNDVHGNHPRVVLVMPGDNAKSQSQALGRADRAGTKTPVLQKIIFAAGTLEEDICASTEEKLRSISRVNEGDGKEISKKALLQEPDHVRLHTSDTTRAPMTDDKPIAHVERLHSRHSPSSLKNKAICPGYRGTVGTNKYAERGTRGHEAIEKNNALSVAADKDLYDGVVKCLHYLADVKKALRDAEGKCDENQEIKLHVVLNQFGHVDVVLIGETSADILDWKFAMNFYPAKGPQFQCYALGVWDQFENIETIRIHTVHPWLDAIDVEEYTRSEHYNEFSAEITALIVTADKADPKTFSPNANCQYCARLGQCPAVAELAVSIYNRYTGSVLSLPDGSTHGSEITQAGAIAALLDMKPILEKALDGWAAAARKMVLEEGVSIPGYALKMRSSPRTITSTSALWDILSQAGVTPEDAMRVAEIPLGAAEELYASKAPKGKKGAFKEELENKLLDANAMTLGTQSYFLAKEKPTQASLITPKK